MSEILNVPFFAVSSGSCTLQPAHAANPARRFEHDQIINLATPRWQLRWDIAERTPADGGIIRALQARLAMGARFRGWDPLAKRPHAYLAGSARPWLANPATEASIFAIDPANWTITLQGLSVGAVVSPGDMASYVIGGEHRKFQHTGFTPVIADSNGRAPLRVAPRPVAVSGNPVAKLDYATSLYLVTSQDCSQSPGPLPYAFSIEAIEVGI
jgi:hypothetical protein